MGVNHSRRGQHSRQPSRYHQPAQVALTRDPNASLYETRGQIS